MNKYQIHFWAINAVLMTFEAKKSLNLISKLGGTNLNVLKTVSSILISPPLLLGSKPMSFYYINSIFFSPDFFYNKKNYNMCYML